MKLISVLLSVLIHLSFVLIYLVIVHDKPIISKKNQNVYNVQLISIKHKSAKKKIIRSKPKKTVTKHKDIHRKIHKKTAIKHKKRENKKYVNIKKKIAELKKKAKIAEKKQMKEKVLREEKIRQKLIEHRIEAMKNEIAEKENEEKTKIAVANYSGVINNIIKNNWGVEKGIIKNKQFITKVDIKIDYKGNIIYSAIEKGSGNKYVDTTAVSAINKSNPLPRPPKDILDSGYVEFIITFDTREKE